MKHITVYIFYIVMMCSALSAQSLFINEVMPANVTTLPDKDKQYSDWLEIYNAGSQTLDLTGYYLSDDADEPERWCFPPFMLPPDSFVVVFASEKDSQIPAFHYETVIDWGDQWYYFVGDSQGPPADWKQPAFNTDQWPLGASGFGYGDGDDATDIGPPEAFDEAPLSVFVRRSFEVSDTSAIEAVYLHIDYDDGFVAYLNGNEAARRNVSGHPPTFDTPASANHEALMYHNQEPELFLIDDFDRYIRPGDNILAIQGHNVDRYSSDMSLIPFLTLEMTTIPPKPRGPSEHLDFPEEAELHAAFKLDSEGEVLLLTDSGGQRIDSLRYGAIGADISYGRKPDGQSQWYYFNQATPGAPNQTDGYNMFAPAVQFSQEGGFYTQGIQLTLSAPDQSGTIRYTMDGTVPTDTAALYEQPLRIDSTTVLRARLFQDGKMPGPTITHTYFMNPDFELPVVSLVTDPDNFFDEHKGIYVYGPDADTLSYPYWGSNFWEDWERPVHLEFFEQDGSRALGLDVGTKIFGSWSRLYPQKSLAIYARSRYGQDRMYYPLFPDRTLGEYKNIVLRNSGQDWGRTFFRDGLMSRLVSTTDLDYMDYRPVLVFLNGRFWGIHNMREKMNEHYLANHHGVDPDNLDFIERDSMLIQGDLQTYNHLLDFVRNNDLKQAENYTYVKFLMDVHNFMDYCISVMFYANSDWPWNNVKCWRPKTPDGRFKWLLFDNDYGFHGGHLSAISNMFDEMRNQSNGTTLLFFELLKNPEHRQTFINRYANHLNTTFHPARVTTMIEEMKYQTLPEMPRHIERWENTFEGPWWLGSSIDSMEEWHDAIRVAIEFALDRGKYVRQHIMEEFGISDGGTGTLELDITPSGAGNIRLNDHLSISKQWQGLYFKENAVRLFAQPMEGYRFDGWRGAVNSDMQNIDMNVSDSTRLTAVFVQDTTSGSLVINEINYNSADDLDTEDWIELHNASGSQLNVSGWTLLDDDDTHTPFELPANTVLEPGEALVLCRDKKAFRAVFPDVERCFGDFDFGFSSNGELIRLFNPQGVLADSVRFGVVNPWPTEPDGQGYTLELTDVLEDNARAEFWRASNVRGGTPAETNSVATSIDHTESGKVDHFKLYANYPNPFNPSTHIGFDVPARRNIRLVIYNVLGQQIRVLADRRFSPGHYEIQWNGRDENGNPLSSGIYFLHFKSGDFEQTHKLMMVR